jgi:hypothetical protein
MKAIAIFCALLSVTLASAGTITVHNTGVDSSDAVVAPGAAAAFWRLLLPPAGASEVVGSGTSRVYNGSYYAPESVSAWVSANASGNTSANGYYIYALTVNLAGLDPGSASITGTFGTDNDGFVRLNGGPNVATTCFACFFQSTAFTISSGFVPGLNTIELGVNSAGNPTAFRVEFSSATANPAQTGVPEPGTLILFTSGFVIFALQRRTANRR